jgi:hypothetical protein
MLSVAKLEEQAACEMKDARLKLKKVRKKNP